ncbi:MAG: hypothetical protein U9Q00_05700 [Synergistota bacterium]|nr:hypothetical protein [Synergistota bacterium]
MKYDRRKGSFLFRLLLVATFLSLAAVVFYFGRSYVEYSRYRRERFEFACDVQEKNLIEQARLRQQRPVSKRSGNRRLHKDGSS